MKISIIGCGNIGGGIARRLANTQELILYDHNKELLQELAGSLKQKKAATARNAASEGEIVVLAVKPQNLEEIAPQVRQGLSKESVLISVLAGTTLSTLERYFPHNPAIRMSLNIAHQYGESVIGLSGSDSLSVEWKEIAETIFSALGEVIWIPENKIDALMALTGSGPAFFLVILEAMADAAIALGFTPKEGIKLALQTVKASSTLLEQSGKHPGELRWNVSSPGGMTIAGLKTMEDEGVRAGIINTFLATYEHSFE